MEILRTPDACFDNLPCWDFEPHYTTIQDAGGTPIRIHHVEEGPADAPPILLMHGNPTWSYLHRHMIRPLAATGRRVIAVDLVGCGRSDKPAVKSDYTLARHYDWMSRWLEAMGLQDITLYCQDWGGTIGLYLVSQFPGRFSRVMVSNSFIPLGEGENEFMRMWAGMMRDATAFPWDFFRQGFHKPVTSEVLQAYRAPFPTTAYEAGITEFPMLIAVQVDNPGAPINRAAWERLKTFDKPFVTVFGALDPIARGMDVRLQQSIPGAKGQAHHSESDASHFIQEDMPQLLVERLTRFLEVRA